MNDIYNDNNTNNKNQNLFPLGGAMGLFQSLDTKLNAILLFILPFKTMLVETGHMLEDLKSM